jgi:hypothetical protein
MLHGDTLQLYRLIISEYLRQTELDAVGAQHYKQFKRWTFIAIGPNEMWLLISMTSISVMGFPFTLALILIQVSSTGARFGGLLETLS